MGILIAIEGTDSSGKQTQSELLYDALTQRGIKARLVSFPAYKSNSSALVRMYLAGDFGTNPTDVNAYAASTFYAVDRFATYRTDWGKDYENGTVIVADRYVPSNIIHQASKLDGDEKKAFIDWLTDLEYGHFGLPHPDATIFLDMPTETAQKLMAERANKIDNSSVKDIHERDGEYLKKSYNNAKDIAETLKWNVISCVDSDGEVREIKSISEDIWQIVNNILSKD